MPLSARTLLSPEARLRAVERVGLGGGNAWRVATQLSPEPDLPLIVADRPLINLEGRPQAEFSLHQLDALADAWAAWYRERGVGPRDRVALYIDDSFEDQLHLAALARLGAIAMLINGRMRPELAVGLIRRTTPVGVYTDPEHLALLDGRQRDVPSVRWTCTQQDVGTLGHRSLPESARYQHTDDDPVVLCHSSGTTGNPKPVIWTHRQSVAGACFRLAHNTEAEDSVMLAAAPQTHSSAIAFTFYALLAGVPTVAYSDPSGPGLVRACATYRPTAVLAFNEALGRLATMDKDPAAFSSVQVWLNLGDAGHEAHMRKLMELGSSKVDGRTVPGSVIDDGLGSSELGWAAIRRLITPDSPRRARYLGTRVPIADVAVLREDGSEAKDGEVGMLGIRSPSLTPGYWNDSDTTYRTMLNGYWLSGDLVHRTEDGDYFHVDRVVDAIHTPDGDGYSTLMEEELLLHLPQLEDCAVVAGTDDGTTVPVAIVRPGRAGADPETLLRQANAVLSRIGQPALALLEVARVEDDIPLGPTGKVLKRQLRERYAALHTYQPTRPAARASTGPRAATT